MNVLYELGEILASFIEVFVLFKFYRIIVNKPAFYSAQIIEKEEKYDLLFSGIGTLLMLACNHISMFSYFTMLLWVVYVCIAGRFMYKAPYIKLFSIASFYVVCINCLDFLVLTIISSFSEGSNTFTFLVLQKSLARTVFILSMKTIWIIIYLLVKRYIHKFIFNTNNIFSILVLSCTGFVGFVFLSKQTFQSLDNIMVGTWFLFTCLIAFIFFAFYFFMKSREQQNKFQMADLRNRLLTEKYESINQIYMGNAKLYHDINNHLNMLYQMLEKNQLEEAKKYIAKISMPIKDLSTTVWTGIDVVDVIINSKIQMMKEKEIDFKINVEFPENTNIQPYDLCTILGNLLDNAIEAVVGSNLQKVVSLTIRKINYFMVIRVTNPCKENEGEYIELPTTSKEDVNIHGFGLVSVTDAIEKYRGNISCKSENNQFIVTVIIFFDKRD